nr:hypothetical protein [Pseudonocardiales bacterium]
MTSAATDPPVKTGGLWPVLERSIIGTVLGIPAVAAIGIAAAFTALGVFIDLQRVGTLGSIFKICYFTGCVLAIAWVRRRGLFGPMVQPPLLLAVTVPAVVLFGGGPPTGGRFSEQMLFVVLPLINGFPTMAVTTLATVGIAVFRYLTQRPPARTRLGKSGAAKPPDKGGGKGSGSAKGSGKGSG